MVIIGLLMGGWMDGHHRSFNGWVDGNHRSSKSTFVANMDEVHLVTFKIIFWKYDKVSYNSINAVPRHDG